MTGRLVVVGHGPAAHRPIEAVPGRQVTALEEEPRPAYDRVAPTSHLTESADPAHHAEVVIRTGALDTIRDLTMSRRGPGVLMPEIPVFRVRLRGARVEVSGG